MTAVLGSSGCGKTTLLRTVAGFLDPDEGTIVLGGRAMVAATVGRCRRVSADIGYVPQEGALFPHLDVARNIAFGLPRDQRRGVATGSPSCSSWSSSPATSHGASPTSSPAASSSGSPSPARWRREPSLVLLDEPFSSLDAGLREDTGRAVVRALQRQWSRRRTRHPRPGRGALAGRPGRGDGGGPLPPGRRRRPTSTSSGLARGRRVRRPRNPPAGHCRRRCCHLRPRPSHARPADDAGRSCSWSAPNR